MRSNPIFSLFPEATDVIAGINQLGFVLISLSELSLSSRIEGLFNAEVFFEISEVRIQSRWEFLPCDSKYRSLVVEHLLLFDTDYKMMNSTRQLVFDPFRRERRVLLQTIESERAPRGNHLVQDHQRRPP
jgi:hypothetical protein